MDWETITQEVKSILIDLDLHGRCPFCGTPIDIDFDGDHLAPEWTCVNTDCANHHVTQREESLERAKRHLLRERKTPCQTKKT